MLNPKIEAIISHNNKEIKGFFKEYRWLSNFEECKIFFNSEYYPSSENAYQAAKASNNADRIPFLTCSPSESKKLGRKLAIRADWDDVKYETMKEILFSKFSLNPHLRVKLEETGDKYLEETNYWKDIYWGVCDGVGQNNLGKLLMEIRESF